MSDDVCAVVCFCRADYRWLDNFLFDVDRLRMPFAMHFDRCGEEFKARIRSHPLCLGTTSQDYVLRPFKDADRQGPWDLVVGTRRYRWVMLWDADETWQHDRETLDRELAANARTDLLVVDLKCLYERPDCHRTDCGFGGGARKKFFNLEAGTWGFFPGMASPSIHHNRQYVRRWRGIEVKIDFPCVHWGYMTRPLREEHFERWARIFRGKFPSKIWRQMKHVDESGTPVPTEPLVHPLCRPDALDRDRDPDEEVPAT